MFLTVIIPSAVCDPCEDSNLLSDNKRSAEYVPGLLDTLICDETWVNTGELFFLQTVLIQLK